MPVGAIVGSGIIGAARDFLSGRNREQRQQRREQRVQRRQERRQAVANIAGNIRTGAAAMPMPPPGQAAPQVVTGQAGQAMRAQQAQAARAATGRVPVLVWLIGGVLLVAVLGLGGKATVKRRRRLAILRKARAAKAAKRRAKR